MKKFTKIMSLLLAIVMVFALVACDKKEDPKPTDPETPAVTDPVDTPVENPDVTEPNTETPDNEDAQVSFLSLSLGENLENVKSVNVFANEDGSIYVEYIGDTKKVGNMDASIMADITTELAKTELETLNGADNYGEGDANGAMYVEFSNGDVWSVNYTGEIPEAFTNGYATMDAFFKTLTESLPEYVPHPQIMGEIDETILSEMTDILTNSGIENIDGVAINPLVPTDEFFGGAAGLSKVDGITAGASGAPMMMSVAYSLVIVKLDEGADASAVAKDFEDNIDWMKWVCVAPSDVLIATKDNMVLCLQAADDMYTKTVAGIDNAGWTHVNELKNPNA